MGSLVIRADAGSQVGFGHVGRCIALAEEARAAGIEVAFVIAGDAPLAERWIKAAECAVVPLPGLPGRAKGIRETVDAAMSLGASWVVLDGYQFDLSDQVALRAAVGRLLLMDDLAKATHYEADLILNAALTADATAYAGRPAECRLLVGSQHALIRSEFASARSRRRPKRSGGAHVLLTLGGSRQAMTREMLEALGESRHQLDVVAVLGGDEDPGGYSEVREDWRFVKDADQMPELMSWADVAVSGAGGTCWELAFMGVPALLITVAGNQRRVANMADKAGSAVSVGWHEDIDPRSSVAQLDDLIDDPARLRSMSAAGRRLVDGKGARRALEAMLEVTPLG